MGLELQAHYANLAESYRAYGGQDPQLELLWRFYHRFAVALTHKCEWCDSAAVCVRNGDRDRARELVEVACENVRVLEDLRDAWQTLWFSTNKPYGYEVIDVRMGGIIARFKSAAKRIKAYADGALDDIPELPSEKLPYAKNADGEIRLINRWGLLVTAGRIQHGQ